MRAFSLNDDDRQAEGTMASGLKREIVDVAARIERESKRRGATGTRKDVVQCVEKLRRIAIPLARYAVAGCNRPMRESELADERRLEAQVLAICHELGVEVRWGDPRGAPIQIPCAPENNNSFGGDAIVIPYCAAKAYERKGGR